tara:strand:- start:744 stop:1118 length:375 start_codon:yes stop_codon:yes gene_type:complete
MIGTIYFASAFIPMIYTPTQKIMISMNENRAKYEWISRIDKPFGTRIKELNEEYAKKRWLENLDVPYGCKKSNKISQITEKIYTNEMPEMETYEIPETRPVVVSEDEAKRIWLEKLDVPIFRRQ